jgi:hypothetical protein
LGADIVEALSEQRANARVRIAFLLLFVFAIALSVGAYYLGKLQQNLAAEEGLTALQTVHDAEPMDDALRRHPSNRFLKMIAMTAGAASETSAAIEQLSHDIEPPALSSIQLGTASRSDLEALRRDLKTAETNTTTAMPRYLALIKTERDRLETYALSLNLEKDVISRFLAGIDRRHAEITALISKMLSARAEFYGAYEKCVAVLISEFGIYKVADGQLIFPIQYMANRYNVAANAMTSATKRIAELEEERKTLMQPQMKEWEQVVGSK